MQEMAGGLISTRGPNGPSYIVLEIAYRSAGNRQTTSFVRFRCDPETRINSRTFSSWYENALRYWQDTGKSGATWTLEV